MVSAAHFEVPVAPDSIAAVFGTNLATAIASGATVPLPETLAGTTVTIEDSLGVQRLAGLFYVSPGQINIQVPPNTASGTATIKVVAGNGMMSSGTVSIADASPSIFTANSDGKGVPAAGLIRVRPGNVQIAEDILQGSYPDFVPRAIDMGPETDVLFLVLYLTGLRRVASTDGNAENGSAENVRIIIGGVEITPTYAGIAPGYVGLDQANVPIPRSLIGRGKVNVSVTAPGFGTSNGVEIEIASPGGAQPPMVAGINGPSSVLAHDQLSLNGTNLPSLPADSTVRIGGIEAGVESATPSQLLIRVPFGVVTGPVTLSTASGTWSSSGMLPVRTSISGFVRDTNEQPLAGAKVNLVGNANFVMTPQEGWFVLPDTPTGAAIAFKVEVPNAGPLPYPNPPLKLPVYSSRDNQYPGTIYLQQASGPGIQFGGDSGGSGQSEGTIPSEVNLSLRASGTHQELPEISISTGGVTFRLPVGATAVFPDNTTSGRITLDVVSGSLTPARMPREIFSQSVAQISPLGVTLSPGGRLIFPNLDGYAPDSSVMLFKYDLTEASFVDTQIRARVSTDGSIISTPPGSITETSYYFVAAARPVTALSGRVLDAGGTNPVRGAVVRARGQETRTDGNGAYLLRNVPAVSGMPVPVTASLLRFSGRVDKVSGESQPAIINSLTKVNDLVMPSATANRPPLVFSPTSVEAYEGAQLELRVRAFDIDAGQQVNLITITGANFVQLIRQGAEDHLLRISPPLGTQGNYQLSIRATDTVGATTERLVNVVIKRRPIASNQNISVIEDGVAVINLLASDVDNKPVVFTITRHPSRGILTGRGPVFTYRPNANFSGNDSFTFKVSNGFAESAEATVQIQVVPINDPPVLVVPGPQIASLFTPLQFVVTATDVDAGQSILLSATGLPPGAAFNPATGIFRWSEPIPAQIGTYVVTFRATDSGSPPLSDSKTVIIILRR